LIRLQHFPAVAWLELVRESPRGQHGLDLLGDEALQPFEQLVRNFRSAVREAIVRILVRVFDQLLWSPLKELSGCRIGATQDRRKHEQPNKQSSRHNPSARAGALCTE
jgi:hypothetical protein